MEIQAISSTTTATLAKTQPTSESDATNKASQPAAPKAGGSPPAGGGAKPAASSDSSASGTSSTEKVYDKRDADQDGVVSYQEELLYSLKHPPEETETQSTASTSQVKAGLSAYQQSQQASNLKS